MSCLVDYKFNFCYQFPELCFKNTIDFFWTDTFAMFADLCYENPTVCTSNGPDLKTICDSEAQFVDSRFAKKSSLFSVCGFNETVCEDTFYTGLCKEDGSFSLDLCNWYPDYCNGASPYEACTSNWMSCLVDPAFDFCDQFSELCVNETSTGGTDPSGGTSTNFVWTDT